MTHAAILSLVAGLGEACKLVETHISWVILVDGHAYKIKKPVQFSFLDFSDLEKRHYYCERELELNRRLSPQIYLEVVPIYQVGDHVSWETKDAAQGELIDYALKMVRLDSEMEMDVMLAKGEIDLPFMAVLARRIAAFHHQATILADPKQSQAEVYRKDFNDILSHKATFEQHLDADQAQQLDEIVAVSDAYLAAHANLIATRLSAGMVRDVHGDLHARNIFAYPEPVVFDCIEFNDHFRQIDVLNEVAFLCMDLEARGFEVHAQAFLGAYLAEFPAIRWPEDSLLFLWFKCYRANVRAKVAALSSAEAKEGDAVIEEMALYLGLMERYALELKSEE